MTIRFISFEVPWTNDSLIKIVETVNHSEYTV